MCLNHENRINIKSLQCHDIKRVEEFKYIGSYIGSTQHDVRIGSGWATVQT